MYTVCMIDCFLWHAFQLHCDGN